MLAVVLHAVDAIFSFSNKAQKAQKAHGARSTVQLLQCKTSNFLLNCGQAAKAELNRLHYESH